MNCTQCDNTGSLSRNLSGHLDCIHCDTAEERMRIEAWARRAAPTASMWDVWAIYQRGKTAGAALATNSN